METKKSLAETAEFIKIEKTAKTFVMEACLRVEITKEKRGMYFSYCPVLDICSQGTSVEDARLNIIEATQLLIESCFERGTLIQFLAKRGSFSVLKDPPRRAMKPASALTNTQTVHIPAKISLPVHNYA